MTIADPCYDPRGSYCVERDPLFVRPQPHPDHFFDGFVAGVVFTMAVLAVFAGIAIIVRKLRR